jgi:hypothetical protein
MRRSFRMLAQKWRIHVRHCCKIQLSTFRRTGIQMNVEGLSENDLHNALDDMADGTIASGVVYSDVEGQRQIPELKMVTALINMMDKPGEGSSDTDAQQAVKTPVITWTENGHHVLMNDYEDAEFFTGAFPTLFPYGKGGHVTHACIG